VLQLSVTEIATLTRERHTEMQSVQSPTLTVQETERRERNPALRRLVDGLLEHVRDLSSRVDELSADELEAEYQRFHTIVELTWAAMTDEKNRPSARARKKFIA
jgi:hypothetical protein